MGGKQALSELSEFPIYITRFLLYSSIVPRNYEAMTSFGNVKYTIVATTDFASVKYFLNLHIYRGIHNMEKIAPYNFEFIRL